MAPPSTTTQPAARKVKRQDLPVHIKEEIAERYWLHRTDDEKEWLCEEYNIVADPEATDDEGMAETRVSKLYNLMSRMKRSRKTMDQRYRSMTVAQRRESNLKRLERMRERVAMSELVISDHDDLYLKRHFGEFKPELISIARKLPESAVLYRSKQLGLRKTPVLWDAEDVKAWLGIGEKQLQQLASVLEIHELKPTITGDRRRRISTRSLVEFLSMEGTDDEARARWIDRGVDEFFWSEIVEHGTGESESCLWLDAGHSCANPDAGAACGTLCANNRYHNAGEDPVCMEIVKAHNKPIELVAISSSSAL